MKRIQARDILVFLRKYYKMTIALIVIGLLAVGLTVITYFTSWSDASVTTEASSNIIIGTPEFRRAVESVTNSPLLPLPASGVTILNNGDEFLPDFLEEIRGAQKSITITNYIWKDGTMMNAILDTLIERAKAGVQVRILIDGKGSVGNPSDKFKELVDAGGVIANFRPLWSIRTILRGNKRSHVRAFVIDGTQGYIGGIAFDDGWLGSGDTPDVWRDMVFKMDGLGAQKIQDFFNYMWRQTDGEILSGDDFYPRTNTTVTLPCTESCFTGFVHAPVPDLEKNLSNLLWLSAQGARDHIYMETPYLLPDDNMLNVLVGKAKAGVDVEIVVPGPYVDSKLVQAASRSYYGALLDAGIKIYEYQPAHMHSKIFTADGRWSVVGSANLDNRSSTLNIEDVMAIDDTKFAHDLETQFNLDKSRSKELVKGVYQTNVFTAAFGRFSRLFAKQY